MVHVICYQITPQGLKKDHITILMNADDEVQNVTSQVSKDLQVAHNVLEHPLCIIILKSPDGQFVPVFMIIRHFLSHVMQAPLGLP
jgi:hypothetical protein